MRSSENDYIIVLEENGNLTYVNGINSDHDVYFNTPVENDAALYNGHLPLAAVKRIVANQQLDVRVSTNSPLISFHVKKLKEL